jgi:hypothetical protein
MSRRGLFCLLLAAILGGFQLKADTTVKISQGDYHGWTNCIFIRNASAEIVIVPAVGRIMQFRFVGEDGPFWENEKLDGRNPDPVSREWGNFGGDKTWPAPQADWPAIAGRDWPPPAAFDSMPLDAHVRGDAVELVSPVDAHFGIRTRRLIRLDSGNPVMSVTTSYEKVEGAPRTVGIWIITQCREPKSIRVPVPETTLYENGYNLQCAHIPPGLKREGANITLTRDRATPHKIGNDAGSLVWIGEEVSLRIESPRIGGANYPDNQSSAEVYTNPDPLPYIELEMLAPLKTMSIGDKASQTSVYTLFK